MLDQREENAMNQVFRSLVVLFVACALLVLVGYSKPATGRPSEPSSDPQQHGSFVVATGHFENQSQAAYINRQAIAYILLSEREVGPAKKRSSTQRLQIHFLGGGNALTLEGDEAKKFLEAVKR
jgi:hypothetical protein